MDLRSFLNTGINFDTPTTNDAIDDFGEFGEDVIQEADDFFDNKSIPMLKISQSPGNIHEAYDGSWRLEPLYREDNRGALRIWEIGFHRTSSQLRIRHGHVKTGNYVSTEVDIATNQSGRTLQEQAILQARKRYMDKYKEELYRPAGMEKPMLVKAALANRYRDHPLSRWPVGVQLKADGTRILISEEAGVIKYRTRENRLYQHFSQFDEEIKIFLSYFPANTILDSEIYNKQYARNQIQSITSRYKNGPDTQLSKLRFHIFDIYYPENPPFEVRYNLLLDAYCAYINGGFTNNCFTILATNLAYSEEDINYYYNYFVDQGYEGIIIRKLAGPNPTDKTIRESIYKPDRSCNLLKYKPILDAEATVIDIYTGSGTEKDAIMFLLQLDNGKTFGVRPKESIDYRRKLLEQGKEKFLGRIYTYEYAGLSEYGVPQHPVGVGFRDYLD